MSLKHAILVLLDQEPGSGYDLTRRFSKGLGHFWQASHQQIYLQLKHLNQEKQVRFKTLAQSGKPDRKVYEITASGRKSLDRWLRQPDRPPVVRDALLIKVFACKPGDEPVLVQELERQIQLHRDLLGGYQELESQYFAADRKRQHQMRNQYLTLRRGIRYEREWIDWLDETRMLLEEDALPRQPA